MNSAVPSLKQSNGRYMLLYVLAIWMFFVASSVDAWTMIHLSKLARLHDGRSNVHYITNEVQRPREHPFSRVYLRNGTGSRRQASIAETSVVTEKIVPLSDTEEMSADLSTGNSVRPNVAEYEQIQRQLVNAILLAITFGYAAYTILNIDSGMSRGWTQSEIAMRIPFDTWSSYESSLAEKPIYTKTLINVVIYLLGDWLSQTVFQRKNVLDFDPVRTLRNGFIGLCFGPLVHKYYEFSDFILPPDTIVHRIEKIVMDQTVYLTVKASIYVAAVGLLAGDDWPTVKTRVQDRIPNIVFTAWKFWPLVHCITYGVIPARHRILWVNCVDLVWNAILATMSRSNSDEKKLQEAVLELKLEEPSMITEPVAVNATAPDRIRFLEIASNSRDHFAESLPLHLSADNHDMTETSDSPMSWENAYNISDRSSSSSTSH